VEFKALYISEGMIGEGTYGTVEKATHVQSGQLVALKHKKSNIITGS
jgi:hypothetical protein